MIRPKITVFVSIIALLTAAIVCFYSVAPASNAYKDLPIGSQYNDLISLAGDPSYETDGTRWVEPEYEKSPEQITNGCVRELWYENIIKIPSKYAFCFNKEDKLIGKYHWSLW